MLNRISRRRTLISGTISGKAKMQKEKMGKVYLPCNSILYNLIPSKQTSLKQIMIMMMMTMMMMKIIIETRSVFRVEQSFNVSQIVRFPVILS